MLCASGINVWHPQAALEDNLLALMLTEPFNLGFFQGRATRFLLLHPEDFTATKKTMKNVCEFRLGDITFQGTMPEGSWAALETWKLQSTGLPVPESETET